MQPTILVPLDGMPLAELALPLARQFAQLEQGHLELLRVVADDAPESAELEAADYLRQVASANETSTFVMRGHAAKCIVQRAAAIRAELIVMSTHARSGMRRAVLGSVAEAVLAHTRVPAVLVRPATPPDRHLRTLLVALDSNCASPVTTVVKLARSALARVVLLRVVPAEETAIWQWSRGDVLDEPQTVAMARGELNDLAAYIEHEGVAATVRVHVGQVVPTILRVARDVDADLIVMATHGRTGVQRTVVGSITDAVIHQSTAPVLVSRQIPMNRGQSREDLE